MKKLLILLMVILTTFNVNAKCNWSTLKLQEWNQRNYYKFYATGGGIGDDTCVNWMYTVYDQQKKKLDTLDDYRGYADIQFNAKGKYTLKLRVWNVCTKCDTTIVREVNLIYFRQCKFNYTMSSSNGKCKDIVSGVMNLATQDKTDTCWEYYYYIYHGKELDDLSQHDWDSMSDDQLYMYYSFNDSDIIAFEGPKNKPVVYQFTQDGHYLLITQWYNKCMNQDTFFFTRLSIELCNTSGTKLPIKTTTSTITVSPNPCDDKVIFSVPSTSKTLSNTYEVYDSKAKLVMSGKMGGSICIGTYNLPNGVYVVKIGNSTQKFIVKH